MIREQIVDAETRINKLQYMALYAKEHDPNYDLSEQIYKARRQYNRMIKMFMNTKEFLSDFNYHRVKKFSTIVILHLSTPN